MSIKELEAKGLTAVKALRKKELLNGIPFMIFIPSLPSHHCLLEFPDGTIKEAAIDKQNNDYNIIRELPIAEANQLKKKYNLD